MAVTVLVAGASRGIGLELVRQYAKDGHEVIAGCRQPETAQELQALTMTSKVTIHSLDTASDASVTRFKAAVADRAINVVIVVAGVSGGSHQDFGSIDFSEMAETLNVNTAGPVRIAQALAPNLAAAQGAKLVAITSDMGSIERTTSTEMMAYRISKAALNEAWRCVAIKVGRQGTTAMVIHPGWVSTAMGGPAAPTSPDKSARGIREVVAGLTLTDAGSFRTYDGETRPW